MSENQSRSPSKGKGEISHTRTPGHTITSQEKEAVIGVADPATAAIVESRALFGSRREITIRHGDQEYRLRITKQEKLILTK